MTVARFDRSALALDVAAASGAWDAVTALMRRVSAYASGIEALRLDPVTIFGTTIDAFYDLPGLKHYVRLISADYATLATGS